VDGPVESADTRASDQIAALTAELSRLRQERRRADAERDLAEQARDLALADMLAHEERLSRVVALCDMAEWAAESEGARPAAVRVDEIRRALRVDESGTGS
jgi:hypothetical protein